MKPDIVLIVTDDQPKGLLDAMPVVGAEIRDRGCAFPTGIITTPLCGPSRSSILTGQWAHTHGVWQNGGTYGGWPKLSDNEDTTIATALSQAGYRTGLFGKYMNGWNKVRIVPPGWDEFAAILPDDGGDGDYYNYTLVGTAPDQHYGNGVYDYSTDVVGHKAAEFVAKAPMAQPLFLYFSPYGSHAAYVPAPRHVDTWPLEPLPPSVNDSNALRSPWLRDLPPVDEAHAQDTIRKQHEVVRSIDEAVGGILTALGGRAGNTLFVFTGDNGLQRGDHRLNGKNMPYQASLNVQMLMRWDGMIDPNTKNKEPITNEDLSVTICDAAETTLLGAQGVNVLEPIKRPGVYVEGMPDDGRPPWIGWRQRRWLYVNFGEGQGEELYDYDSDRWEALNLAAAPVAPAQLASMRSRTLSAGHTFPPGFMPYLGR